MNEQKLLELIINELSLTKEEGSNNIVESPDSKLRHFYVAYSGGVDSTALLSLMCQLRKQFDFELTALHANHQLNSNSTDWEFHCQQVCDSLDVPLISCSLNLVSSSEQSARSARYNWFSDTIKKGSILLTGHHRQDRVETLLFNLFRGSGSQGLSSMRAERPFNGSALMRPLIHTAREDLISYVNQQKLAWVEDPSNKNNGYSRNHIRNVIVPTLQDFRPDAVQNIARAAWNLEQENNLLREVAISDLVEVREEPRHPIDKSYGLCFEDFKSLSLNRQSNLVRFWLQSLHLHIPSQRLLMQLLEAFITPQSSTTVLQESGVQFRFYKGFMYVMPAIEETDLDMSIHWSNVYEPIDLFEKEVRVGSTRKLRDLYDSSDQNDVRVTSRKGLNNPKALQGHSLNLKKWLQDIGVPPWRRSSLPILTMVSSGNEVVLGPVDQQIDTDWVSLEHPVRQAG